MNIKELQDNSKNYKENLNISKKLILKDIMRSQK
jgi:hypothetical protein